MVRVTKRQQVDKAEVDFRVEELASREIHKRTLVLRIFGGEVAVIVGANVAVTKEYPRGAWAEPLLRQTVSYDVELADLVADPVVCWADVVVTTPTWPHPIWSDESMIVLSSPPVPALTDVAHLRQGGGGLIVKMALSFRRDARLEVRRGLSLGQFAAPLLNATEEADVTVRCQGREFVAHSVILKQRSPFFERMLAGDFKEARTKTVELHQYAPEVVEHLLYFIYNDDVATADAVSWQLFDAARYTALVRLEELCLRALWKAGVTEKNYVETLTTAFFHDLDDFFEAAASFVVKNGEAVAETEEWQQVEANDGLMQKIEAFILT